MQLFEVKTAKDKKEFLHLPLKIYKNDTNWVRPLDKDIKAVFDPLKNKFFRHGECIRWILKNEHGKTIGRVAAFVNKKTAGKNEQPTGGMGFFDCVDDKKAAFILFDACKAWLQSKEMQAMDGPINFGERDSWWGLIIEGFMPPPYKMNYNQPYYKTLFEEYGFKEYYKQLCYSLDPKQRLHEKLLVRHEAIKQNPDYKAVHIKKNQLDKFAEDFRAVYNKAWAKHGGGKELGKEQVQFFFKSMKPVIDEKIIWYVYYKNEPVGVWVSLPDINQLFKKLNGKFGWLEKVRFVWMLKRKISNKIIGIIFGIVPDHQGKGVDSFLIVEGANVIQKDKQYLEFEMQWIGDFNPKMIAMVQALQTVPIRTLATYRYLFDRTKEFKRHPVL